MSISDQLAAYRAKKAAQKEAETKENSSFFTRTFSVLRSRSKTTASGGGQSTTQEDDMVQTEQRESEPTQVPVSTAAPAHRDDTSPHRDLLTPPAAPRPNVLSRFLLNDRLVLTRPRILKGLLWLILWGLFIELQFGCVFFIVSSFYFVYTSMESGTRDKAQPSAYSVFNENCERIDGTFTTEQFEKELRYGAMSVH